MKFKTLLKICCVQTFFNLILMLETKNWIVLKKKLHQPIQTTLVWFGSDFIFKVNWTKQNRMLFSFKKTACFFILQFGWLLSLKSNQTALQTPLIRTERHDDWNDKEIISLTLLVYSLTKINK